MKDNQATAINLSLSLLQNASPCTELPQGWEKKMTLNEMKLVCRRANCPSSWQRKRSKAKLANLLNDKVWEHSQFLKTIHLKSFQEYLKMGLDNLSNPRRKRRKLEKATKIDSPEKTHETAVEKALASAVHIIPSGSGVHVGSGLVLTCAHCVTHDDHDDEINPDKLGCIVELVTAHGKQIGAVCTKIDNDVDLALLQIPSHLQNDLMLSSMDIGTTGSDSDGFSIFALGNPCDIDLETDSETQRKNGFFPFHVSEGRLESKISSKKSKRDDLGRQIHSAWTYWGHSGCPLIGMVHGENGLEPYILSIHNSWDERNGNRHGISLDEIISFVRN